MKTEKFFDIVTATLQKRSTYRFYFAVETLFLLWKRAFKRSHNFSAILINFFSYVSSLQMRRFINNATTIPIAEILATTFVKRCIFNEETLPKNCINVAETLSQREHSHFRDRTPFLFRCENVAYVAMPTFLQRFYHLCITVLATFHKRRCNSLCD